MPTTRLLAMIACLVLASACEQRATVDAPPPKAVERTTTIWSQPEAAERVPRPHRAAPHPADERPAMSLPPVEKVNETPPPATRQPAPPAPNPPPSDYQDGCGRPLIT